MKRNLMFLSILLAATCLFSCVKEKEQGTETPLTFSAVPVSIGQDGGSDFSDVDTRSQITLQSENFVCAYLFAFDSTTKKILSYPNEWSDHQGEQGGPVAKYTTSKSFNWALPVGVSFDIWAIVNPGTELTSLLNSALGNSNLKESDLYGTNLIFSCPGSDALKALDVSTNGTGIPMSGRMDSQRLNSASDGITITVKRLFAKYNIRFNASAYENEGYTVNAFSIRGSKSNTEVPFFWDGNYAQTNRDKLNVLDYGTNNDLVSLNAGQYITLYFLENCQGTKSGVTDWNTVYKDLNISDPTLDLCSYIEVAVNVTRAAINGQSAVDESFIHRIYVGETFLNASNHTYNFDVKRNLYKNLMIYLKPDEEKPGTFLFTNEEPLSVNPGGTIAIPFVCNGISGSELEFTCSDIQKLSLQGFTTSGSRVYDGVTYAISGTATYLAANSSTSSNVTIAGGKNLGNSYEIKDTRTVSIEAPIVIQDLDITFDVYTSYTDGGTSITQTLTSHGEDLYVPVKPNDGNTVRQRLSGRVKYGGIWHDITTSGTPLIEFHETGMAAPTSAYWGNGVTWNLPDAWMMPGDVDVCKVIYNGQELLTWTVNYQEYPPSQPEDQFQDIQLTCEATVLGNSYAQGNTFSSNGSNMQILVDAGGNYVTYIITGQVKYGDTWHDLTTDSHTQLYVGSSTRPWTFTTGSKITSGSTTTFQVYFGTSVVKTWEVTAINASSEFLFDITCTATSNGTSYTSGGADMYVPVTPGDGNVVTVSITGRIYYSGSWHQIGSDSNLKCYLDGQLKSNWGWSYAQESGDHDPVSIELNGVPIRSWTIYYE